MAAGAGTGLTVTVMSSISLADAPPFPDARCASASDWFVEALLQNGEHTLRAAFGHGSPFVYLRHTGSPPHLRFAVPPSLWAGSEGGRSLGITVRGRHYGLFGPAGSSWRPAPDGGWHLNNARDYFSVALLPDAQPQTFERFEKCAHRHVVGTHAEYEVENGYLHTTYRFTLRAMEGEPGGTLYALYPHQWKHTSAEWRGDTYRSVRGEMRLYDGPGFSTRVPVQGLLPLLPGDPAQDRMRLLERLARNPPGELSEYKDTYWEGKGLGKLATLAGVAESIGRERLRAAYLREIRDRLENWFTASGRNDEALFYYDQAWGALIGSPPSYGSDNQLNDHHFHYGYFIRAAAEVARHDPSWASTGARWWNC